jgi:hypothetical protein
MNTNEHKWGFEGDFCEKRGKFRESREDFEGAEVAYKCEWCCGGGCGWVEFCRGRIHFWGVMAMRRVCLAAVLVIAALRPEDLPTPQI